MLFSPLPALVIDLGRPTPSSLTSTRSWSLTSTSTHTWDAAAWRATLASDSRSTDSRCSRARPVMAVSSGPSKRTCGANPSEREASRASIGIDPRRRVGPERSLPEFEDHGTDVADHGVELADRLTQPCLQSRVFEASTQPLEPQPGAEQLRDDTIVQVHGDAFAVLEQQVLFRGS